MFRRRPLGGLGPPQVPPLLRRANRLFADGQYAQAAEAYEQLANRVEGRFPQRAPFLFMEAGRAQILAGNSKAGMAHLSHGLTVLGAQGRFQRMQGLGGRVVNELKARGLIAEADEIAKLLRDQGPKDGMASATPAKRPLLPTNCPSCGGALRADELEWMDEITAECAYCGTPVRSQ